MKDQTLKQAIKLAARILQAGILDKYVRVSELEEENDKLNKKLTEALEHNLELESIAEENQALVNRLESITDDEINKICQGEYYKMIDQNVTGMVQQVPRFIKAFINHIKEG